MKLAIYSRDNINYGILVIIRQLEKACSKRGISCRQIFKLADSEEDEIIMPVGLLETKEMLDKGMRVQVSFLVDAISLGAWNKFLIYTKVGYVFQKDYIRNFLQFLRWRYLDSLVAKRVDNIIVVSKVDGDYLKRINPKTNIIVCPNGISRSTEVKEKVTNRKLTLGVLSSFGSPTAIYENAWFIKKYFRRLAKNNDNVELILAGRGKYIDGFSNEKNVRIIGEVEDLADFFNQIDLFVAANAKGCGILNRVLDAFIYQVPVIGHINAFSGFGDMHDAFLTFDNYRSFEDCVKEAANNTEAAKQRVDNAYNQMFEYYDWDKNYGKLVDNIIKAL